MALVCGCVAQPAASMAAVAADALINSRLVSFIGTRPFARQRFSQSLRIMLRCGMAFVLTPVNPSEDQE
jgi:hypothetical protein